MWYIYMTYKICVNQRYVIGKVFGRLLVVKLLWGDSKVICGFLTIWGVGTPNLHIVQESSLYRRQTCLLWWFYSVVVFFFKSEHKRAMGRSHPKSGVLASFETSDGLAAPDPRFGGYTRGWGIGSSPWPQQPARKRSPWQPARPSVGWSQMRPAHAGERAGDGHVPEQGRFLGHPAGSCAVWRSSVRSMSTYVS